MAKDVWTELDMPAFQSGDVLAAAGTGAEQFFANTAVWPVALMTAGRKFRPRFHALLSTPALAAGSFRLRQYLVPASGTPTTLADATFSLAAASPLLGLSNAEFYGHGKTRIVTPGAAGSSQATHDGYASIIVGNGLPILGASLTTVAAITTADTTQPQTFRMSVTFTGIAAGAASVTLRSLSCQYIDS